MAFRQTIDREIGNNLWALDLRDKQIPCDLRRVAEMQAWLGRARSGASMPAIYPWPPITGVPYLGAWNTRDAETYRKLAPDLRQKYALIHDGIENLDGSMTTQYVLWAELRRYTEPGPMSLDDRRSARQAIERLGALPLSDRKNFSDLRRLAKAMGLGPVDPQNGDLSELKNGMFCRSVLKPYSA